MILSMKKLIKFGLIFTMAATGFVFTACQDGEPGPTGTQGEKGEKGDVGDTGANGDGYDELTPYGNIVVRYKGTRTDDVAFDKTIDFKFSPVGPDVSDFSRVWEWEEGSTGRTFQAERYSSPAVVNGYGTNNYAGFWFPRPDDQEEDYEIYVYSYTSILSDDMKFFALDLGQYFSVAETITDYSFTSATGELKFKFHVVIPANQNETNHELDIAADVNVKVVSAIGPIDNPE